MQRPYERDRLIKPHRPSNPRVDLSKKKGNPTNALQNAYSQLMEIQNPEELVNAAMEVVLPFVGASFSKKNYATFVRILQELSERGVLEVQKYLTNFILKGSGFGVVENKIAAIASIITEDADENILTQYQQYLKILIESNTNFNIALICEQGVYDEGYGEYDDY